MAVDKPYNHPLNNPCNKHPTELLTIHASLLDHASLLEDFRKSVIPILNTANPAMDADGNDLEREKFRELLRKECNTLLSEIETLEMEMGTKTSYAAGECHELGGSVKS